MFTECVETQEIPFGSSLHDRIDILLSLSKHGLHAILSFGGILSYREGVEKTSGAYGSN